MRFIFDWEATKAKANLRKHKVSFDEAKTVFNDPLLITFPDDRHSAVEDRQISISRSASRRLLLVVHTEREEPVSSIVIRIISCRKATASERRTYEEG
ncbi:MAG: BrnT family toxin [Chloroflexi bacterium]|nr:BrnT family toxin [Chloroflexota bacterium]